MRLEAIPPMGNDQNVAMRLLIRNMQTFCQESVCLSYLSGLEGLTLVCHSNAAKEWQTSVSPSSAIFPPKLVVASQDIERPFIYEATFGKGSD